MGGSGSKALGFGVGGGGALGEQDGQPEILPLIL